jgi:hypothetical protein
LTAALAGRDGGTSPKCHPGELELSQVTRRNPNTRGSDMTEVHDPPPGGKGDDPSSARLCLRRFIDAAYALDAAWHTDLDRRTYPRYLPSFDDFVSDLLEWRDEVEEHAAVAESDIDPIDLADPAAVRTWLTQLRIQVDDALAAGEDATRPLNRRILGRPMARRTLMEARHAIHELLEAAERGAVNSAVR